MTSISRGTPPGEDTLGNTLSDMMPTDAWDVPQRKSTDFGTLSTIAALPFGVPRQIHVINDFNFYNLTFNFSGNATL